MVVRLQPGQRTLLEGQRALNLAYLCRVCYQQIVRSDPHDIRSRAAMGVTRYTYTVTGTSKKSYISINMSQKRVSTILSRLGEVSENDRLFLEQFFTGHPKFNEKFANYAQRMVIALTPQKTPAVHLVKRDNSVVPISTLFKTKSVVSDQTEAFRNAVWLQCRATPAPGVCELCQEPLLPAQSLHVDHDKPLFCEILAEFLNTHNIALRDVKVVKDRNNIYQLSNIQLRETWEAYHYASAKLRVIHAKCNLTRKRKSTLLSQGQGVPGRAQTPVHRGVADSVGCAIERATNNVRVLD